MFLPLLSVSVLYPSLVVSSCVMSLAESEGTLILPTVESFHRLQDDDATTVTSDDSFFSAAEVGFTPVFLHQARTLFL